MHGSPPLPPLLAGNSSAWFHPPPSDVQQKSQGMSGSRVCLATVWQQVPNTRHYSVLCALFTLGNPQPHSHADLQVPRGCSSQGGVWCNILNSSRAEPHWLCVGCGAGGPAPAARPTWTCQQRLATRCLTGAGMREACSGQRPAGTGADTKPQKKTRQGAYCLCKCSLDM